MAKRANGEGTIRKRHDGRWEGRYYDPIADKQKSVYGKTQKEVREKLSGITQDILNRDYIQETNISVSEWLKIWLEQFTANVKPLTKSSYEVQCKNHIIPRLGNIRLKSLSVQHIQKTYNDLFEGRNSQEALSAKTIKNIHGVLHKALEQAVKSGYIKRNPSDACILPKVQKKAISPLNEDEIKKFMIAANDDKFMELFLITLFTGMRQGEILGLTWDCIDFEKGVIYIYQQLQKEKKKNSSYYLISLKNGKTRTLSPAPYVFELLKRLKQKQKNDKLLAGEKWTGDKLSDNFVFTNPFGEHLAFCTVYKHYKAIVERIGAPESRFHDLRHTFAVISLQNGDDIKTIQDALGHHTAAFTLDVYGHVSTKMNIESAKRMENYIHSLE